MVTLKNEDKYINESVLRQCFVKGSHSFVDKMVCGNGFSTRFLTTWAEPGKQNIIIVPLKSIARSKERQYMNGEFDSGITMSFVYEDSEDSSGWDQASIVMFVADSFIHNFYRVQCNLENIRWILIDESHSVEIQASFRKSLKMLPIKINQLLSETRGLSVVSVTASPNVHSPITHTIENRYIERIKLNVSYNIPNAIDRVKESIKRGRTVVATNDVLILEKLRKKNSDILQANFIIGDQFKQTLSEKLVIVDDKASKLVVMSSAGFEGHDLLEEGYHVYFFENRGQERTCFYRANLYQALNRTRKGADYYEYVRVDLKNERKPKPDRKAVNDFVYDTKLSAENKMSSTYKPFHEFVIFTHEKDKGVFSVQVDQAAIRLNEEKIENDKGFHGFNGDGLVSLNGDASFFSNRRVEINYLNDGADKLRSSRLTNEKKIDHLYQNGKFIEENNLFNEKYWLEVREHDTSIGNSKPYLRDLERYLRRKNYNGLYTMTDREKVALRLFSDQSEFDNLVCLVRADHDRLARKNYSVKKARKRIKEFKVVATGLVYKWIQAFCNERVSVPKKMTGHRDYNISVPLRPATLQIIASKFDVTITEVDIVSAFPRFLYALNGLYLPEDFYGENKKNKIGINVAINDFFYDDKKKSEMKIQRRDSKTRLKRLGFHDDVIAFLIDQFFVSKFRGGLFNFLSYQEKKIISKLKNEMAEYYEDSNIGVIRRHDSLLIFNNTASLNRLSIFEYLEQIGWFKDIS